jgi:hypothetical protein
MPRSKVISHPFVFSLVVTLIHIQLPFYPFNPLIQCKQASKQQRRTKERTNEMWNCGVSVYVGRDWIYKKTTMRWYILTGVRKRWTPREA